MVLKGHSRKNRFKLYELSTILQCRNSHYYFEKRLSKPEKMQNWKTGGKAIVPAAASHDITDIDSICSDLVNILLVRWTKSYAKEAKG